MYIVRHGKGRHGVVGLHGWSGDHRTFDPLLPYLNPEITFFAVDLPGCGKSPEPKVWEMKSLGRELARELIALDHVHLIQIFFLTFSSRLKTTALRKIDAKMNKNINLFSFFFKVFKTSH